MQPLNLKSAKQNKDTELNKRFQSAIIKGYIITVEQTIMEGADIHAQGEWAFRWAARCGYLNIVKLLLEHGADIHKGNDCALMYAIISGRMDVAKFLIEHGSIPRELSMYQLISLEANHPEMFEYYNAILTLIN